MRCPKCEAHATPFWRWAHCFVDDPKQCRRCGTALRSSSLPILGGMLLALPASLAMMAILGVTASVAALRFPQVRRMADDFYETLPPSATDVYPPNIAFGLAVAIAASPFVVYFFYYVMWSSNRYTPAEPLVAGAPGASGGGQTRTPAGAAPASFAPSAAPAYPQKNCPSCSAANHPPALTCWRCGGAFPVA